jgi:hypothetical protein
MAISFVLTGRRCVCPQAGADRSPRIRQRQPVDGRVAARDDLRGARLRVKGRTLSTALYSAGRFDLGHDAVMRIGGEAPRGGSILLLGVKPWDAAERAARIVIGCESRVGAAETRGLPSAQDLLERVGGGLPTYRIGRNSAPASGSPVVA